MSNIIIELNKEVTETFLNGMIDARVEKVKKLISPEEYKSPLEDLVIPFDSFSLKIPTGVFLSEEQIYNDTVSRVMESKKGLLNKGEIDRVKKLAKEYHSKDTLVIVDVKEDEAEVEMHHENNKTSVFTFNFGIANPSVEVILNDFAKDGEVFAGRLINLIIQTLAYINEPKKEVLVTTKREVKNKGKKKGKRNNKTYIYKKVYKVLGVKGESKEEVRPYTRRTKEWGVRGHWREYKSGKRIWIESFSKGEEAKEVSKNYRITKIDI